MKILIAALTLLALASTAEAQPRRPEHQAAEQGFADAAAHKAATPREPPAAYRDCLRCSSTAYSYWSAYWTSVTWTTKGIMGR